MRGMRRLSGNGKNNDKGPAGIKHNHRKPLLSPPNSA